MSKVETPTLVNPFTIEPSAPEERSISALPAREVTFKTLPSAPPVKRSEQEAEIKKIEDKIKAKAMKALMAALRYRDANQADMDAEDMQIAADAMLPDKEVPYGLKVAQKTVESFLKQQAPEERPQLAIQINFGGEPVAYPRITVEEDR